MSAALVLMDLQAGVLDRYPEEHRGTLLEPRRNGECRRASRRHPGDLRALGLPRRACPRSTRGTSCSPTRRADGWVRRGRRRDAHPWCGGAGEPGDLVVLKKRASAFSGSDLGVVLRSLGVTHLVLTGLATSGVVLSTLRERRPTSTTSSPSSPTRTRITTTKSAGSCARRSFPLQAGVTTVADWTASL